jgi:hypothetical protein
MKARNLKIVYFTNFANYLKSIYISLQTTTPAQMISAVLIYNQSIHSTTGYTPFSLLYGPYENLNAHKIDLEKTIYETYNNKRKKELLPFYEQLYQKQLDRGTKILDSRNKNLKDQVQIKEPAVYVKKQKIRKADPCYEKVNVTSTNKNKIIGKKEKSKFPANAHLRNIKRLRKTFFYRLILLATSLALRLEKIHSNGYFLEDIGTSKTINHYHKFYIYFNISNIESSYKNLLSNAYILELKYNKDFPYLIKALKDTCMQIGDALLKFNYRSKRSLIDGLGSAIRFITGNLDQDDLKEINSNIDQLFKNQEKIIKQVNKYTSFASHITKRYTSDMQILQKNINTSLEALNKFSDQIENQMLIQHNMYLAEKLLDSIQSVQRMITLAFNEISNLEIISAQELFQILHHLKLIYKRDELIELNGMHVLKIIEFSKFKILSVDNVITCILYIPILDPNPYTYQRIYPLPNLQ